MERHKGKVQEVSEKELKSRLSGGGGDDRRGAERVPARLQVEVPLANWEQFRSVYTTNISKGGLLFSLASPASIPATVDLTLTLPDGTKVTLQSEVRHVARRDGSTEFDVGVQFQDLDAPTRRAFEEALAALPGR
ncbi:MAG TPA: PilZ domain-containing protein [Polyangia bacterium]